MRWAVIIMLALAILGQAGIAWTGEEPGPFVYDDGGRRDPFWPLVNKGGGVVSYDKDLLSSEMILQGIMSGNDGTNVAIINGLILKEGETIGLYRIETIDQGSVVLTKGDETVTLTLIKEE